MRSALFITFVLLAGCGSLEAQRASVLDSYAAAVKRAEASFTQGDAALLDAKLLELRSVEEYPALESNAEIAAAKAAAVEALKKARARERSAGFQAAMADVRARLAAGTVDAATRAKFAELRDQLVGANYDVAAIAQWNKLDGELAADRSERECRPRVDPLVAAGKLVEARDLTFSESELCSAEMRAKTGKAYLSAVGDADLCKLATETLALARPEEPVDAALAADPTPRLVATLAAQVSSGNPPPCAAVLSAKLAKGVPGALTTAAFAPLKSAFAAAALAQQEAAARSASLAANEAVARVRSEVERLVKAGKLEEAHALALAEKDEELRLRLAQEHPTPAMKRLRARIEELGTKAPHASALLHALAWGLGDITRRLDATETTLLARPEVPRWIVPFMFAPAPGVTLDAETREALGQRVNAYAVQNDGGWLIRAASAGRQGSARTVKDTTSSVETRRESRQVRSGDGITTRTVYVDVPYEVTQESTYVIETHGDFWLSMTLSPSAHPEVSIVAGASAKEPGEASLGVLLKFRIELNARWNASEDARVKAEPGRRLGLAVGRLDRAKSADEREDALAEVAILQRGKDKALESWFIQQYGLPSATVWPW